MQRRPQVTDHHMVITLGGHTLRGSWEEILAQLKASDGFWAEATLADFMAGGPEGRREAGWVHPMPRRSSGEPPKQALSVSFSSVCPRQLTTDNCFVGTADAIVNCPSIVTEFWASYATVRTLPTAHLVVQLVAGLPAAALVTRVGAGSSTNLTGSRDFHARAYVLQGHPDPRLIKAIPRRSADT